MFRYPLGGMLSWALQYISGLKDLGHEVYVLEMANYPNACYSPRRQMMTNDPDDGIAIVDELLSLVHLSGRWCFVDYLGNYHGMTKRTVMQIIAGADILIDGGNHGAWLHDADSIPHKTLIDGEPGYTQIKWETWHNSGRNDLIPNYDSYVTNGLLIGSERCSAPTAGRAWYNMPNPVNTTFVQPSAGMPHGAYTTMMNWSAHKKIDYKGVSLGQKDVEMERFIQLPRLVESSIRVAASGPVQKSKFQEAGWIIEDAQEKSQTLQDYYNFIAQSKGEWSVAKNIFVTLRTGWFSDRSAAYLATGRPVILQDTGFSEVFPTGLGLLCFNTLEEAGACIESANAAYARHCEAAREFAIEYLDSKKLLRKMLELI